MKMLLTILLLLSARENTGIAQFRELFLGSYKNEASARQLNGLLRDANADDPIALGYKGVSEIMLCNYVYSPFSKLSHFSKGKRSLESAISLSPASAELRYLRFTIQSNVPSLLGYRDKINEDKDHLLTYLLRTHPIDRQLDCMICDYLLSSPLVSKNEKDKIRSSKK